MNEPQYTKHTKGLEKIETTRSFNTEPESTTRKKLVDAFRLRLNSARKGKYRELDYVRMAFHLKGMGNHELNKLWLECDGASSFTSKFWSIMKA